MLVCVVVIAVLLSNLKNSRVGRAWNALREDEIAAVSAGITASRAKLLSVVLSAGIAGFAGSLYAYYQRHQPRVFLFMQSVIVVCMVVLGGMGSIPRRRSSAPIVLQALPQARSAQAAPGCGFVSEFEVYRMLIFGIIIVRDGDLQARGPAARHAVAPRGARRWTRASSRRPVRASSILKRAKGPGGCSRGPILECRACP